MDCDEIVNELLATPMQTVEEARTQAPDASGFYAWWCDGSALPPEIPAPPHPIEPYGLLYIGVAPSTARSTGSLRKRLRQHTSANIGSSTFRLGLTALLWEREAWRPLWTDRPTLADDDRAALDRWQREHLQVRWCETAEPWTIESAVIATMEPPMNRAHNERHPFYTSMGVARNDLRRAARQQPLTLPRGTA